MWLQSLLMLLLVAGSFVYAAWALLPQLARRALAQGLLRWPLPRAFAKYLQQTARAPSACHCSGCDRAPATTPNASPMPARAAQPQPLHFQPRPTRYWEHRIAEEYPKGTPIQRTADSQGAPKFSDLFGGGD